MVKSSLFLVLLGLIFSGCGTLDAPKSDKVPASQIRQSYNIGGSKDSLAVEAVFSADSKDSVELVEPSKVEFNGKKLIKMEVGMFAKHPSYQTYIQTFAANQVITFTNQDGSKETYEITLNPLEITDKNLEINLSKGGELTLSRPVENDETVNVLFDSTVLPPSNENNANTAKPKYASSFPAKLNADRTKIIVDSSSLNNFVTEKAKVYVSVTKEKTFDNSAKGVSLKSSYKSETVMVNVKN